MKSAFSLSTTILATACLQPLGSSTAGAAILLLDPSNLSGTAVYNDVNAPYGIAGDSSWNRGGATYGATEVFSDGSASGTTTVVKGGLVNGGGTVAFDLGSPYGPGFAGNSVPTVFSGNPSQSTVYSGTNGSENDGVVMMRVSGLAAGSYDIFVVAAYLGQTTGDRPGGSTPTRHAIWAFGGDAVDILNYDTSNDTVSGTGIASQSSFEVLENTATGAWTAGDNFAKQTVTLGEGDALYVISSGNASATGSTNQEYRGWLNLVQVVSVPEPSTTLLGALGAMLLLRRRR